MNSSLNADFKFDKVFNGVLSALSSSIFLFITHASISFFCNMIYISKDNIHHCLIIEASKGSNLYPLVVLTHNAFT